MKDKKYYIASEGKSLTQEMIISSTFNQISSCVRVVLPNIHEGRRRTDKFKDFPTTCHISQNFLEGSKP